MRIFESPSELGAAVGEVLGVGHVRLTQHMIDQFADTTFDDQWIHTDVARATAGPFGAPIAHGYLTLSLVPMILDQSFRVERLGASLNYGINRVRFPSPVPAGTSLEGTVRLAAARPLESGIDAELEVTLRSDVTDKPHCVAAVIVRLLDPVEPKSDSENRKATK